MEGYFKGFNRQQGALDAIAKGWKTPFEDFNRQQVALDAIAKGWKTPFEDFNRQQVALDAIAKGWKTPFEDFNRQQVALDAIAKGWKTPFEDFNRQQVALDAIAKGWKTPFEDFNRQQGALDAIAKGWKTPFEDFNRQQVAIQKIMSSLENTFKVQSFDFSGSLLVMNDVIQDTRFDIETKEKSNLSQVEQELITWLYEQIEIAFSIINSLRNISNAIDTKKAIGHMIALIGFISAIITIVGSIQGNNTEIHIHNQYDNVIIKTETNGDKTDIYIEKKESPLELQSEDDDKWYTGGERT
ncbi:hypothetical protein ACSFXN_10910 [Planococcus sp. 1R117A]|uniref:hypothetical protein n=1 Tax=Planococcus sp. 1R117A TaxID=3447020 RepID=UPI003EDBA127